MTRPGFSPQALRSKFGPLNTLKSRARIRRCLGNFGCNVLEIGVFETYDMLYLGLDIYSSAPIKDMGRRGASAVEDCSYFRRLEHAWIGSPLGP
jgi:hypothetical protein